MYAGIHLNVVVCDTNAIVKKLAGIKVKWKNGIYLLAFLGGIVIVNLPGNEAWTNNSILNRYTLASLSFREIVYEEYFFEVLYLRFQTVLSLWICSKFVPKRIVKVGFAIIICGFWGGITAIAILANGLWGILFCLCALFPHTICYVLAYTLWGRETIGYVNTEKRKEDFVATILMIVLIGIGCFLEAYISPVLIDTVIKY